MVGQIAKIQGGRVVGITSSEEKCTWLVDQLGFDAAVSHNSPSFIEDLSAATPDEIDVYWDNVGGRILEAALSRAAKFSRFVLCGGIGEYNTPHEERVGTKHIIEVAKQRIRMEGFVVLDHLRDLPQARAQLFKWIAEGKLSTHETIMEGGIRQAEAAFAKCFTGDKLGKLILEVKPFDKA